MIHNPPAITSLLRSHAALLRAGIRGETLITATAVLMLRHLGHLEWDAFLRCHYLYLQAIPRELAQAAWGKNHAAILSLSSSLPTDH